MQCLPTSWDRSPLSNLPVSTWRLRYGFSCARRVSVNAFGIVAWQFRLLSRPMELKHDAIDRVDLAACILHNWLRKTASSHYMSHHVVPKKDFNVLHPVPSFNNRDIWSNNFLKHLTSSRSCPQRI